MPENLARKYRERSTEEILSEQQELESLKYATLTEGKAYWSWDASKAKFTFSKAWQMFSGYPADELYPSNPSPLISIESQLPDFIDDWVALLDESDEKKKEIDKLLRKFLLSNHSASFEYACNLRLADGSKKFVLMSAIAVWRKGRLDNLFVRIYDLTGFLNPANVAKEIAIQKAEIASNAEKLKALTSTATSISPLLAAIFAALLAGLIGFNQFLERFIVESRRTFSLITNPALTVISPKLEEDVFLPELSGEAVDALIVELGKYATYGDVVKISAYSPDAIPDMYRILFQTEQGGSGLPLYTTAPQVIANSATDSARAERHLSRSPFLYVDGPTTRYSVPFRIKRMSGDWQTFFASVDLSSPSQSKLTTAQNAMRELAAFAQQIIQASEDGSNQN